MPKPLLLVTMGDPAGIGPEISARALVADDVREVSRPLVVGDARLMERTALALEVGARVRRLEAPEEALFRPDEIEVWDIPVQGVDAVRTGEVQALAGRAAFVYIQEAIRATLSGRAAGIVTAPINKESLRAAKVPFIGHTEMLAELTGSHPAMTMFEVRGLRIFFLTRHLALAEAIRQMTRNKVLEGIRRSIAGLKSLGVPHPSLAVAGLNPHAGEDGLFGDEEQREIRPAVETARSEGYEVTGPLPADSVFHHAAQGRFDAVLALYHDQGHIAAKMMDFERTVSVTLGLPILRTSVDHGTAFDIAGKGIASPVSLVEAIRVAARYASKGA